MPTPAIASPRRIHVLFKTHLDVGFTDSARAVVDSYVGNYIPRAVRMARRLREKHGRHRFIWTTGSWLIHHCLEVASPARRRELERAIAAGDIVWHGLPFTTHTELMDETLFRTGLGLSQELDKRFGRKTRGAKMTDVPGHTRAMVPLLAEAGIDFLHLGVNPASRPPAVPSAFRWRHPDGSEINVVYNTENYGGLAQIPGCPDALYFAHTGDNHGPCTPEVVEETYAKLHARFPKAELMASTLDQVALALSRVSKTLPVVTKEIGDTWIHGVGTDPAKVALFRAWSRWFAGLTPTSGARESKARLRFARRLLLVPEHTWGRDIKLCLGYENNHDRRYRTHDFQLARDEEPYRRLEASWKEQRAYLDEALAGLKGTPAYAKAEALRRAQVPRAGFADATPSAGWRALRRGKRLATAFFEARWNAHGALDLLVEKRNGRIWADARHPLGELRYEIFSSADYAHKWSRYNMHHKETRSWSVPDFLKPGVEVAVKRALAWRPVLRAARVRDGSDAVEVLLRLVSPRTPVEEFGCPREFEIRYRFASDSPKIEATVQWFGKQACRVPEATWFDLHPRLARGDRVLLRKLGSWIDPTDVVRDGNRTLHAVERCRVGGKKAGLLVHNLSAPLVAPERPSLVRFVNRLPKPGDGLHFNLHNNTWGTNFPLWYGDDARFEFVFEPDGQC